MLFIVDAQALVFGSVAIAPTSHTSVRYMEGRKPSTERRLL